MGKRHNKQWEFYGLLLQFHKSKGLRPNCDSLAVRDSKNPG
jgi:hypothetical protein